MMGPIPMAHLQSPAWNPRSDDKLKEVICWMDDKPHTWMLLQGMTLTQTKRQYTYIEYIHFIFPFYSIRKNLFFFLAVASTCAILCRLVIRSFIFYVPCSMNKRRWLTEHTNTLFYERKRDRNSVSFWFKKNHLLWHQHIR